MSVPTDRYVCELTFYVRYAETDQMGIVHHSNYLVYCEELRSQYARDKGTNYADYEKAGLALAVSEINLRFISPAVYGQQILMKGWVVDIKSRRMTFGYEISNPETGQIHVTGTTSHISIDREGKVARIPQAWLERWTAN